MTEQTPTTAAQPIQGYCGNCDKPTNELPCPHCSGIAAGAPFGASPLPDHLFTEAHQQDVFVVFVYRESVKWWERYREHDERLTAVTQARDLAEKGTPAAVMRQTVSKSPLSWVMSAVPDGT